MTTSGLLPFLLLSLIFFLSPTPAWSQLAGNLIISLSTGHSAVSQGVAVRLLRVDHVEPEPPTVTDGQYSLRRPLLLLSKQDPNSLVDAFADFALSPLGQAIIGETDIPMSSK